MKNWDIASMIIGTKKQIILGMGIPKRPCIPDMAIDIPRGWKVEFGSQIVKKYPNTDARTWRKDHLNVC